MTREKIHELLDTIAANSTYPIKSFEVSDYEFSGEVRVAVTFQVGKSKFAATATPLEPSKGVN